MCPEQLNNVFHWVSTIIWTNWINMSNVVLPFSRANTTVMATGPVNGLGSFMVILSAHVNEATAVNNAKKHGGPVI